MSDYSNFKNWILNWMDSKDWKPQKFQSEAWKEVLKGQSGLINAPTGSGKTFAPKENSVKDQSQGLVLND